MSEAAKKNKEETPKTAADPKPAAKTPQKAIEKSAKESPTDSLSKRVLVDVLEGGTSIRGRKYEVGDQEKISPEDFELLSAAGLVREAKADASKGPEVLVEVTRGPFKRPGWTFATGKRFTAPAGLLQAHPNQLKMVGV